MLYRALELTLAPALRAVYRPEVTGLGARPARGPRDPRRQPRLLRRRVLHPAGRPAAGRLLRQGRVLHHARACAGGRWRRSSTAWARCRSSGPTRASAASVIDIGVDVLREGRALGIFPEGTRSPDGRLLQVPHRRGPRSRCAAARPSCRSALVGTRDVQPPGSGCGTARRSASTSARRCTSATAPARSAARGCCARSPRRSAPPSRSCPVRSTWTATQLCRDV